MQPLGYVKYRKVMFRRTEVFTLAKSVFRDVRKKVNLGLMFGRKQSNGGRCGANLSFASG